MPPFQRTTMMIAIRRRFLAAACARGLIAGAMWTEGVAKHDSGEVDLGRHLMTA
jgi:hypothetical protein